MPPPRKKTFRERMLDPANRRSSNVVDIRGPNLEVPVRLGTYPDNQWYDPFKPAPGKVEHDRMRAEQAVRPSGEAMKKVVSSYSEKIRSKKK